MTNLHQMLPTRNGAHRGGQLSIDQHPMRPKQKQLDEWNLEWNDGASLLHEITTEAFQWGADCQLEQVIHWLNFDYQTDPNLSRDMKHRGGFDKIAIALEKAMRPQQQENN